jgi:hypothetical protein
MIINKQTLNPKIMNKLIKTNTPKNCTEMYLDWLNNWLTTESMAEYHNLETKDLERIIEIGRKDYLNKYESVAYKNIWLSNNTESK